MINAGSGEPQGGVRVTLTAARPDGSKRTEDTITTSRDGRYSFARLPTGDIHVYTLDAFFDGGTFAGGAVRLPDDTQKEPVIETTLRVRRTTSDPRVLLIRRDDVFVVPSDTGAGVIESITIINQSHRSYIGRGANFTGAKSKGPGATLGFALPEQARSGNFGIVRSDIDIPEIVPTDFGFAATVAIPPGEMNTIYSYELAGEGARYDLSRTALYPTVEMSVFAEPPLEIESNRFTNAGDETVGGKRYTKWEAAEGFDSGDPIAITAVATEGGGLTIIGAVAAFVIIAVGLVGYVLRRARRKDAGPTSSTRTRDELLVAIAELDMQHDTGEVTGTEWSKRRGALKKELEESSRSST